MDNRDALSIVTELERQYRANMQNLSAFGQLRELIVHAENAQRVVDSLTTVEAEKRAALTELETEFHNKQVRLEKDYNAAKAETEAKIAGLRKNGEEVAAEVHAAVNALEAKRVAVKDESAILDSEIKKKREEYAGVVKDFEEFMAEHGLKK